MLECIEIKINVLNGSAICILHGCVWLLAKDTFLGQPNGDCAPRHCLIAYNQQIKWPHGGNKMLQMHTNHSFGWLKASHISNLTLHIRIAMQIALAAVAIPIFWREWQILTSTSMPHLRKYTSWKAPVKGFQMIPKSPLSVKTWPRSRASQLAGFLSKWVWHYGLMIWDDQWHHTMTSLMPLMAMTSSLFLVDMMSLLYLVGCDKGVTNMYKVWQRCDTGWAS